MSRRRPTKPIRLIDSLDADADRLFIALLAALGISALAVPQFALPVIGVIIALIVVRSAKYRIL